jgi:hypothetical protein
MTDGIIKGNGNSRYLKTVADALTLYPTYEDFMTALVAGTLPVDFNGINADGWSQIGAALNKANLLTDAMAAKYGLGAAAVPNDMWNALGGLPIPAAKGGTGVTSLAALATALGGAKIQVVERNGTGSGSFSVTFSFTPTIVFLQNMRAANMFYPYVWGSKSVWMATSYSADTTVSGNTLTVTPSKSTDSYFNGSGQPYRWIAIG